MKAKMIHRVERLSMVSNDYESCVECGFPLFNDDACYVVGEDAETGDVACCKKCAEATVKRMVTR